jgi:hypothetical protein
MQIRSATVRDAAAIASVHVRSWQAAYADPVHWDTGVGRLLMAAALGELAAQGRRPVRL